MPSARKVVLHCKNGVPSNIAGLASQFVKDGVVFVATVGPGCQRAEDIIDKVAIEHGSPDRNFILTSSHPDETLEEVIEFARSLSAEYAGEVQVVEA